MLAQRLMGAAAVSGGLPESLSYVGVLTSGDVSGTSHTFASASIGTAASNRLIVALVQSNGGGDISLTIGGVSATFRVGAQSTDNVRSAIFTLPVTSGTTADIVVTRTSVTQATVYVYAVYTSKTTFLTGTDTTSPYVYNRTYVEGDFYLGVGRCLSTATETWSNATERDSYTLSGVTRNSAADYGPAVAGLRSIQFQPSTTSSAFMASLVITS